jgi:membrane protease subunit (stomatin/prohibitin family)
VGLFSSKKEGGMMDMIRCDEQEFLIWKWRPEGNDVNTTNKENAIRWGSSLRVKDGEVAVFVYKQKSGSMQDFIEGPFDETIKAANFPILASIVGLAFGGGTPFQAEVYFINLSKVVQFSARVPYFDIFDPRFIDFGVKCAVQYQLLTQIKNYKEFIKIHRLANLTPTELNQKMRPIIDRHIKALVINIPKTNNLAVVQIETQLDDVNIQSEEKLKPEIEKVFGIQINNLSIDKIELDKDDPQYHKLRELTADINEKRIKTQNVQIDAEVKTFQAQTDLNIKNLQDTQRINVENTEDSLRIQREQYEKAQSLQTETNNLDLMKLKIQTDAQKSILTAAAGSLGEMGSMNLGGGGGAMNPAGMMTGMMLGGAMGNQMAGMMNQMGNSMNPQNPQPPGSNQMPPPPPVTQYMLSVNGQQSGPFNMQQLQQLLMNGQLQRNTYVWKQGMPNWVEADQVMELQGLFNSVPPPPPPPPMP